MAKKKRVKTMKKPAPDKKARLEINERAVSMKARVTAGESML